MPSDPSSSTTTTTASPIPCPLPPPIEQCKYSFEMDHAMFGTSRDQWTSPSPYRSFYDDPLSSSSSLLGTGQKGEGHSSSSSSVSTTPSVEPSWNQNNQGSMNQFPNMGNNGMMMNSGQNSATIMNTNNNNNNTNGNIASNNTTNYNTTNPMMMMSTYNNMNSSSSTLPTTNSLNSFSDNNNNNYNNGSIFSANNHLMNIGNTMNQMMMMQNNYAIGMPSSMFNNSSFYTPNNNNLNNLNTFNSFYNLNNGTSNFGNFNPLLASQPPPPLSTNNTLTSFSNMPSLKPIPYENGSIIDPEMEDEIFELPSQWSGVLQHYSSAAEWIVSEEFNHSMMEEENLEMILKIMKWYDESQLKLRNGERAQWAVKTLDASSEYSTQWGAVNIAGPSRVYPKYGDFSDAWAPRLQQNSKEFFIVEFSDYYKITGIQIYETFNPGAVTKITCLPRGKDRYTSRKPQLDGSIIGTTTFEARPEDWIVLYEGPTQQHSIGQHSRIFSPSLTNTGVESKVIYVEMDTTNSASWSEVDAVKLIGMPVL